MLCPAGIACMKSIASEPLGKASRHGLSTLLSHHPRPATTGSPKTHTIVDINSKHNSTWHTCLSARSPCSSSIPATSSATAWRMPCDSSPRSVYTSFTAEAGISSRRTRAVSSWTCTGGHVGVCGLRRGQGQHRHSQGRDLLFTRLGQSAAGAAPKGSS